MRQFQCVHTTYVISIDEIFTISFFLKTNSQPLSFIQRNTEHVEMNNFSCSLSCTWMTIIHSLFYFMLLAAYLEMFHWSILLKLLVVWLY